jgi:hypothetical protein
MAPEPDEHDSPKFESKRPAGKEIRQVGLLSVILWDLLGITGIGIGLGYLAWAKWGAPWWVLLLSSLGGMTLGFYRIYQISKREL